MSRRRPADGAAEHQAPGSTTSRAASAPSSSQSWPAGTPGVRGREAEQPGSAMPSPTPGVDQAGEIRAASLRQLLQGPRAGRHQRPGAQHAGDEAQQQPRRQPVEHAHGRRGHDDADEAHPHQRRRATGPAGSRSARRPGSRGSCSPPATRRRSVRATPSRTISGSSGVKAKRPMPIATASAQAATAQAAATESEGTGAGRRVVVACAH